MRAATLRAIAAATLALAAARAPGVDVTGSIGGGWVRSDTWTPEAKTSSGGWDLNLHLDVGTDIVDPGLARLSLGADYGRYRSLYHEPTSQIENWRYRATLALLSATDFPLTLTASRYTSDVTSDSENFRTGSTEVNTLGGTAAMRGGDLPNVTLAINRSWATTHAYLVPEISTQSTSLSVMANQARQSYTWNAVYNTSWNGGTRAESDYRSHDVSLEGSVPLGGGVDARFIDRYTLRDPRQDSPLSPRLSALQSSAGVTWKTAALTSLFDYSYSRSLGEFVGAPDQELVSHGLAWSVQYPISSRTILSGTAGASFGLARVGTLEERAAGQQLGGHLSWQAPVRGFTLAVQGGFNVGVLEPSAGGTEGAWGLNAGVNAGGSIGGWVSTGSYYGSYSKGLGGQEGSTLSQNLVLTTAVPWTWAQVTAQLNASASRRDSGLFGTGISRSISTIVNGRRKAVSLSLHAGAVDGLAPTLQVGTLVDGLFLPASFNSHSWYVTLIGSLAASRSLSLSASAQIAQAAAAGQATQTDRGLTLAVGYVLGEFVFTLDDRIANGGVGGRTQTGNIVMLRASRSFGASF